MKIPKINQTPKKTGGIEYPHVSTWDVISEYWKTTYGYRWAALVTILSIVVATSCQSIIAPLFYKKFFDVISTGNGQPDLVINLLVQIVFMILGINLIAWVGNRVAIFSTSYFEIKVMMYCREFAFDYILGHSHSFFINNFTGTIVQRISRFSRSFERVFDRIALDVIPLVLKVTGTITVLYFIQPAMALGMLVWILVFAITSYFFTRFKLKYDVASAELDSRVVGRMSDAISNHNSIQLFTSQTTEVQDLKHLNHHLGDIVLFRWNLQSGIELIHTFLSLLIEFLIFYFGIKYWNAGLLTIGTFALVQSYISTIGSSLWNFSRIVRDLYEGIADAKEMVEMLHLNHEVKDSPNSHILKVDQGLIEFKNVGFKFGTKPVFDGISISIKPGEKVAFIGSSGAGKSTLVKLLMRLHDIQSGEILIDGQNIQEVTQESLRNNVSLVPQDPALFHRTLMENIRYGRRDATDAEVMEAARLAHCDVFINELPLKYETFVGERGVKLSGGERQRVAIARAILKNAPILILDEATSSLDSHSESLIQDALHTLMKGKTTIVIAHRLSTIRNMDRIIVVSRGGVVEEGSHEDLIKKPNGVYAKLWSLQAGGFAGKSIEELLEV